MTRYFSTPENPSGGRLEDILSELQNEIVRRSNKLLADNRPEARAVLHNNIDILGWLGKCVKAAQDSTRIVNSIGPPHGPDEPPRIGEP